MSYTDECRYCGAYIALAADGAWQDESHACGCGVDEHEPGGFNVYANRQRTADTPWWDGHEQAREELGL